MAVLVALACGAIGAQERRDPGAAERELRKVRAELQEISRERRRLEGQRGQAETRLRRAEGQLRRAERELAGTEEALQRETQALAGLERRRDQLRAEQAGSRERLARLLRASYTLGGQAPLKLLLAQDRAADAQRALAYHRYAQREHARQVRALSESLAELSAVEEGIAQRRAELESLRARQQETLAELQRDRGQRLALLWDLDSRYQDRQQREKALGKDAQALEQLLKTLRAAAARAAAEKRAAEQRAREQAQASRGEPAKPRGPVAAATPPPKVGGLGWPASGDLLARYGGKLPDGRTSSGVLIGTAAGAPVTAVADGTVVFSEWMTGYGLILIVDHGNGYMSLYAHNDALLRKVGERVRKGDTLARVGTSGGHGRPALYFELRRDGKPVDPAGWLQRR
ncbi:murein hydrolase activator EnvC family protein [Pseudoxanthomonas suwonensis]|uniref:murein hydrolase activator EnvC family protein n=1 Tax=Pseudoxanthomonas suwonensis TaxID=314722 RepID=UPI00138F0063|nr:peptidoglycan DD-metalloendopeptidase family protein [Pseudoxanthomonas suwonensis]KAF1703975.1 peptidase M23 [Pseudoxanthomonas suwonensis]